MTGIEWVLGALAVIAAGAVAALKKPKVLMPPQPGGRKLARELEILDWRPIRRQKTR